MKEIKTFISNKMASPHALVFTMTIEKQTIYVLRTCYVKVICFTETGTYVYNDLLIRFSVIFFYLISD